jgi:dolichol-phosphate mannosyltransferase
MLRFALVAILNFSNFPLRLAIYFGFFSLTLSFCVLFWALATHFSGHTVQGWTSLLVVFLFGQSVTLLITGIIGLYIGQIHSGVQGRPRYIVMNSVQSEPARDSLS